MMQVLILEELRLNLSFCLSQKTFWHILNKFDNMERVIMAIHVMTSDISPSLMFVVNQRDWSSS